jgi:hypothetical protein
MIYETRRAGEALAKAVRRYRFLPSMKGRYIAQPRACGQGFEVVWYPDGPALPYHGVGRVVEPSVYEHDMAVWFMQHGGN